MSDPIITVTDLDSGLDRLAQLDQWLDAATEHFKDVEDRWEGHYDTVSEDVVEEYEKKGRKTDPSQARLEQVARTQNRVLYREWRNAKLDLEKAQKQASAIRAVVSGRQTLTNLEKAGIDRPQPSPQHFVRAPL